MMATVFAVAFFMLKTAVLERLIANYFKWIQLSSHLIVAVYGFVLGFDWIFGLDYIQNLKPSWAASIYAYAVLSVIWSVVAAYLEVCMLMHDEAIRKPH